MNAPEKQLSFCLTICSRQRPILLRRALNCLLLLKVPKNTQLTFLVIENNDTSQYDDIIKEFSPKMPLTHVMEPRAGLVYARNKVFEVLSETDITWMGAVDDDQTIDPNWLVHMVAAIRQFPDTQMFVGNWQRIPPKDTPHWYPVSRRVRNFATGRIMHDGIGGNTAMHASVFKPAKMGLRFDIGYNFLGGEDTDFSEQFRQNGGTIRYVKGAVSQEEIHSERNTLQARMDRVSESEYILAKIRHHRKSVVVAWLWTLQILYRSLVFGILNMVLAAVLYLVQKEQALKRYGLGLLFFAKIRGLLRYYFGSQRDNYREVDGS